MNNDLMTGYLLSNSAKEKPECNSVTAKGKSFEYGLFWRIVLLLGVIFVMLIIAATIAFSLFVMSKTGISPPVK